jgi:CubicO group peptidase (beta-lactamase class C family)
VSGQIADGRDLQKRLDELLGDLSSEGAASAAVALVGDRDAILGTAAGGRRSREAESPPSTGSLFDLASLSKPVTATLALGLDREGTFPLAMELGQVWPSLDARLARMTGEDLLRHRAGFRPWVPLYALAGSREAAVEMLLSGELLGEAGPRYSDLDYILWGATAETVVGSSLGELLASRVLSPLGLVDDLRSDLRGCFERVAECTLEPRREERLALEQGIQVSLDAPVSGEIQDGNARWWSGYSGHAGLFGTAASLWVLAREWLVPRILDVSEVRRGLEEHGSFRVGWWSPRGREAAGPALGESSFGHTGFTGGSVWVDPERDRIYVLLAHRTNDAVDMNPWRRRLHALR